MQDELENFTVNTGLEWVQEFTVDIGSTAGLNKLLDKLDEREQQARQSHDEHREPNTATASHRRPRVVVARANSARFLGIIYTRNQSKWKWSNHIKFRRDKSLKTLNTIIPMSAYYRGPFEVYRKCITSNLDRNLIFGLAVAGYWNIKGQEERDIERLRETMYRRYLHLGKPCAIQALRHLVHMLPLKQQCKQEAMVLLIIQLSKNGCAGNLLRYMLNELSRSRTPYTTLISLRNDNWTAIMWHDITEMVNRLLTQGCIEIPQSSPNGEGKTIAIDITIVWSVVNGYCKFICKDEIEVSEAKTMSDYRLNHTSSNKLLPFFGEHDYKDETNWLSNINSPVRYLAQCLLGGSPMNGDLHRRKLVPSPLCRKCGKSSEDIIHMLRCDHPQFSLDRSRLIRRLISKVEQDGCDRDAAHHVTRMMLQMHLHFRDDVILQLGYYLFKAPTYLDVNFSKLNHGVPVNASEDIMNNYKFNGWVRKRLIKLLYDIWILFSKTDNA